MNETLIFSDILSELQNISSQNADIISRSDDILSELRSLNNQSFIDLISVNLFTVALCGLIVGLLFVLVFKKR